MIRAAVIAAILLFAGPAFADCSNPSSQEGVIIYNSDHKVMQFCDGTTWWSMKGVAAGSSTCVSDGLVAHWTLDESSGTNVPDSAGSNDGTLTNMDPATDWVAGKIGNALDFDGVNDFIDFGSFVPVSGGNPRTLAAWIKASFDGTYHRPLMEWGVVATGARNFLYVRDGTSALRFELSGAGEHGTTDVTDGTWHHVVVLCSGNNLNTCEIWLDGSLELDLTTSQTINTGTTRGLDIGNTTSGCGNCQPFEGLMDDLRIYNRALSASEVSDLYNGGAGCQ